MDQFSKVLQHIGKVNTVLQGALDLRPGLGGIEYNFLITQSYFSLTINIYGC